MCSRFGSLDQNQRSSCFVVAFSQLEEQARHQELRVPRTGLNSEGIEETRPSLQRSAETTARWT